MTEKRTVDVAINVYGKPYQTAITLLSLLKHSGQWIDKIYFIEERKQPANTDLRFLYTLFGDRLIRFRPSFWLWTNPFKRRFLLKFSAFRHAIRYQYAWEKSDKQYLLITHNDVLYTDDLVGAYLQNIGDNIGIGKIGQCWNCPAHTANRCDGNRYWDYRPSKEELADLVRQYPGPRTTHFASEVERLSSWPTPECRLNEYTALINLKKARPVTMPEGPAIPFGAYDGLDVATRWFWDVSNKGYRTANFDFDPYAQHDWIGQMNSGHAALFDDKLYARTEAIAREQLRTEFGIDA